MNAILDMPVCALLTQTATRGEPLRILIVDDDTDIRKLEAGILKKRRLSRRHRGRRRSRVAGAALRQI